MKQLPYHALSRCRPGWLNSLKAQPHLDSVVEFGIVKTVIFACVRNAGRSQMAAAFFNKLADPAQPRALSTGTAPGDRVHLEVVAVMHEEGIDLDLSVARRRGEIARTGKIPPPVTRDPHVHRRSARPPTCCVAYGGESGRTPERGYEPGSWYLGGWIALQWWVLPRLGVPTSAVPHPRVSRREKMNQPRDETTRPKEC